MSKRVPQVVEAGGEVVGLSSQFRVHAGSFGEIREATGGFSHILQTNHTTKGSGHNAYCRTGFQPVRAHRDRLETCPTSEAGMAGVTGKAVLITGGGSGVGQAAAKLFA